MQRAWNRVLVTHATLHNIVEIHLRIYTEIKIKSSNDIKLY